MTKKTIRAEVAGRVKNLSPVYDQASACGRVSNLIKGLLAADIFASR